MSIIIDKEPEKPQKPGRAELRPNLKSRLLAFVFIIVIITALAFVASYIKSAYSG